MTPATNLGAATPVALGITPGGGTPETPEDQSDESAASKKTPPAGSAMERKAVNDAAAYLRGLAELRGRDQSFAEAAVRDAASLSAREALERGVIDVVADDLDGLLEQIDGRTVRVAGVERVLATRGAAVEMVEPDWRNRVLAVLAHPQLALVLMMLGIYGLFFEFTSPGFGVPGVAGAICLLIALFAFQMLPINWTGVALLALGAALMLAEAFVPSFGVLGVGGIVAFVLGGLFLIDEELPGYGIPPAFIAGITIASALVIFAIGSFAARSHKRPVLGGRDSLIGAAGRVSIVEGGGRAWANVGGESWQVRSTHPLRMGDPVRVIGVDGLLLDVEPQSAPTDQPAPGSSP
jgi:membrane-bound serine protease (ClpP class)